MTKTSPIAQNHLAQVRQKYALLQYETFCEIDNNYLSLITFQHSSVSQVSNRPLSTILDIFETIEIKYHSCKTIILFLAFPSPNYALFLPHQSPFKWNRTSSEVVERLSFVISLKCPLELCRNLIQARVTNIKIP